MAGEKDCVVGIDKESVEGGLHGTIERVTNKVFLLSPKNVDVRDAPAVRQARDGFFNQS